MLLGRERELATLVDACGSAEAGRGSAMLVVGEPGIGKTALRLAGWAVELDGACEQHFYVAGGRCEGSVSGRLRRANFGEGTDQAADVVELVWEPIAE